MKKFVLVSLVGSVLVLGVVLSVAREAGLYSPSVPTWFKGSTEDKVEKLGLIQPSYADLMLWTGIRLDELYMGGRNAKWQYARHQAMKIRETLEKAALVDPSRREGVEGLLSANYPGLIEAIESGDSRKFEAAFGRLYASCIRCHMSHNVAFLPLIPTTSVSPITSGSLELWGEIQKQMREQVEEKE